MRDANGAIEVSVSDVATRRSVGAAMLLLDVRGIDEHAHCRIEGATLVPLPELQERVDEVRSLAAGRPIVAYCHHGMRSLHAAHFLRQAGVAPVQSMSGGIDAWSVEVDPAVPRY